MYSKLDRSYVLLLYQNTDIKKVTLLFWFNLFFMQREVYFLTLALSLAVVRTCNLLSSYEMIVVYNVFSFCRWCFRSHCWTHFFQGKICMKAWYLEAKISPALDWNMGQKDRYKNEYFEHFPYQKEKFKIISHSVMEL